VRRGTRAVVNVRPTYAILHRDATLLVVDKAAGVLTVAAPGSRERCLLDDLRRDALPVAPVHRLDRETSGVLLLCLASKHRAALEALFRGHEVTKEYLALVHGIPHTRKATIDLPILDEGATARVDRRGQRAVTHYAVEGTFRGEAIGVSGPVSLLRVRLDTGRHNQIRVHLAHLGHPLLGDRKYGLRNSGARSDRSGSTRTLGGRPAAAHTGRGNTRDAPAAGGRGGAARCMLHAERLALKHPASGARLDVHAPLPADFAALLDALSVSGSGSGPAGRSRS
jgi:RluA family pseudouridine synthase